MARQQHQARPECNPTSTLDLPQTPRCTCFRGQVESCSYDSGCLSSLARFCHFQLFITWKQLCWLENTHIYVVCLCSIRAGVSGLRGHQRTLHADHLPVLRHENGRLGAAHAQRLAGGAAAKAHHRLHRGQGGPDTPAHRLQASHRPALALTGARGSCHPTKRCRRMS